MSRMWDYQVYGLRIASAFPLPCPSQPHATLTKADVEILRGEASLFHDGASEQGERPFTFRYARRQNGTEELRWAGAMRCLVEADGRRVLCDSLNGSMRAVFHTHLAGQLIAHALIKLGYEPLHATTLVVDEGAIALLGDCGYGKSTLAAAFLKAGFRLLTDDLLTLTPADRSFLAHPGMPRIKLFPEIARALLGDTRGSALNPYTRKLVIPLSRRRYHPSPIPLRAVYCLTPASRTSRARVRALSPRRACLELIKNTFVPAVQEPRRLGRLLQWASQLAMTVPVRSLAYPRRLHALALVREAVLADARSCRG